MLQLPFPVNPFFFWGGVFKRGSHYVALVVLELAL